jgi:CheY-like chemotaxis protein
MSSQLMEENRIRILIADDGEMNRKLFLRILNHFGYDADIAHDGLEALNSLRQYAYDVVFMDINMPHMDGITVVKTIQSEVPFDYLPVFVATSAVSPNKANTDYEYACFDHFLPKPLDIGSMRTLLDEVVRQLVPHAS